MIYLDLTKTCLDQAKNHLDQTKTKQRFTQLRPYLICLDQTMNHLDQTMTKLRLDKTKTKPDLSCIKLDNQSAYIKYLFSSWEQ